MRKVAIKLKNISKKYTLHHEKPTLVENVFYRKQTEEFWALKHLNCTINQGEKVGIIGSNGSGKTTLLEIIAGITAPTQGKVITNGKVVSLIELESGFHLDLTGEENIYLNGMLVGMSKKEIRMNIEKIVAFADIGKFIDTPFYTYSEGMKLRLGFSIVAHTNPDILLLDENLAVGDKGFRKKSFNKIKEFIEDNKTVIVVSHMLDFILETCDRVIWLEKGMIKMDNHGKVVIENYLKN